MLGTNITNFRKNTFGFLEQIMRCNGPVDISTKTGNAVLISEEDYSSLMETLYLFSPPKERARIIGGLHTSLGDCLSGDEVTR